MVDIINVGDLNTENHWPWKISPKWENIAPEIPMKTFFNVGLGGEMDTVSGVGTVAFVLLVTTLK